jgi:hypothetical protein
MAANARNKIQRLLRQLDQDPELEPEPGARHAAAEESQDDTEDFVLARRQAVGRAREEDSTSSVGDLSTSTMDMRGGELPSASEPGPGGDDGSESLGPSLSSLDTTPSYPQQAAAARVPAIAIVHKRDAGAAAAAQRVAVLERKVLSLMGENRQLQAAFAEAMARRHAETAELQVGKGFGGSVCRTSQMRTSRAALHAAGVCGGSPAPHPPVPLPDLAL